MKGRIINEIIDNVKQTCEVISLEKTQEFQKIVILTSDSFIRNDDNFVIRKRSAGVFSFLGEIRDLILKIKYIPTKDMIGTRLYMRCYRYFNGIDDAINAVYQLYPETISYPHWQEHNYLIKENYNEETVRAYFKRVKRPLKKTDSLKIKKDEVFNNLKNVCLKLNIPFDNTNKRKIPDAKLYKYLLFLERKYKQIPANRNFESEGRKRKYTYAVYCKRFGSFRIALQAYRRWKKLNNIITSL